MVFNTTFNNISVILWWPVLLVEEARVPRENYMSVYVQGKKPNVTETYQDLVVSKLMVVLYGS